METGIHALRMILGGVFDQYPNLQLILGHWGEMIPFYLARVNEALSPAAKHLQRPVADYFLQQVYVTPSGMFTLPPFLLTLQIMGADRIMYAVDYPFIAGIKRERFLSMPRSVLPTKRKLRMAALKRCSNFPQNKLNRRGSLFPIPVDTCAPSEWLADRRATGALWESARLGKCWLRTSRHSSRPAHKSA